MRGILSISLFSFLLSFAAEAQTILNITGTQFQTKSVGRADGSAWVLTSNGYIEHTVEFPSLSTYVFQIQAKGEQGRKVWPVMELRIDNNVVQRFTVNSKRISTYSVAANVPAGAHTVRLAFINDEVGSTRKPNLTIARLIVSGPAAVPAQVDCTLSMNEQAEEMTDNPEMLSSCLPLEEEIIQE